MFEYDSTFIVGKMGSGKTMCTLSAIRELFVDKAVNRVLICATKKICESVWKQEAAKWEHLCGLSVAIALGTPEERLHAINSDAQIVCINYENVPWIFSTLGKSHGFDGLVIDELSKLKSPSGKTFKTLRRYKKDFTWRVGLTGTPTSEDFMGLYSQCLVLDDGAALGTRLDTFKTAFFFPTDYMQYNWALKDTGAADITKRIKGLVHVIPDYRDSLPPITYDTVEVDLPEEVKRLYKDFAKDMLIESGGDTITADNAAVLVQKLQQIAQGFLYYLDENDNQQAKFLHDEKIHELSILLAAEAAPTMIAYWFKHDLEVLKHMYPDATFLADEDTADVTERWNKGEIDLLFVHPRSAGHGLDLGKGGSRVIWLGPQWSRDLLEQTNARVWRKGQKYPVRVTTIVAKGTVDEAVLAKVEGKGEFDKLFMEHLSGFA